MNWRINKKWYAWCGKFVWQLRILVWVKCNIQIPPPWRCGPARAMASSFLRFLDHTQRRITVGRTQLDAWSVRRRDLYLTTHNTHKQTDIHAPGGTRIHNVSRRAAVDLLHRPRGHWDRLNIQIAQVKFITSICLGPIWFRIFFFFGRLCLLLLEGVMNQG